MDESLQSGIILFYIFLPCEVGSSEEAPTEVNQQEVEERKKELEDMKTALQQKRTNIEEHTKKVDELNAALDERKKELEERNAELEKMKSELNELNSLLEEKTREADESMDKYCSLMVQVHKLEETNEALTTQLEQLSVSQRVNNHRVRSSSSGGTPRRRSTRKSCSKYLEEKLDDDAENMAPSSPRRSTSGKRAHRDISDKDGAQEALRILTKKIKANTVTPPKPRSEQEDDEFRPEGLPELVQKGNFSSVTSSPASSVSSVCVITV